MWLLSWYLGDRCLHYPTVQMLSSHPSASFMSPPHAGLHFYGVGLALAFPNQCGLTELWNGALHDTFLLILHSEISMSHMTVFSENLLITGMSYFCTVSPRVSFWVYTGFQSFLQVLGLPGFMPCSLCPSGDC